MFGDVKVTKKWGIFSHKERTVKFYLKRINLNFYNTRIYLLRDCKEYSNKYAIKMGVLPAIESRSRVRLRN